MGNMNNLMRQAKKMQEQMMKMQEELEEKDRRSISRRWGCHRCCKW